MLIVWPFLSHNLSLKAKIVWQDIVGSLQLKESRLNVNKDFYM